VSLGSHSIRLLPLAEDDLRDLLSYVAADRPAAAHALADRIEKKLRHLCTHPRLGKTPNDEKLSSMGYRFLVVEDYLVFYTIRAKTLLVHRIIHGARDVERLL
jgi:toxin ParE1/3/4